MQEELTPNYGCQADRLTPIPRAALAREARTPTPTVTPDAFLPAATEDLNQKPCHEKLSWPDACQRMIGRSGT